MMGPGSRSARLRLASLARDTEVLLDRQRIDRRADCAGDRNRRRDEQEFIDLVGGAVVRELLELEDLAHGHPHDRDRDPVPGLVDAVLAFVWTHLAAPGVA